MSIAMNDDLNDRAVLDAELSRIFHMDITLDELEQLGEAEKQIEPCADWRDEKRQLAARLGWPLLRTLALQYVRDTLQRFDREGPPR